MTLSRSSRSRSVLLILILAALSPALSCSGGEEHDDDLVRVSPDEAPEPPVTVRYDDLPDGTLKFDASGRRWMHDNLTWCLRDMTSDLSRAQVIEALEAAAAEWANATPLTLRRVDDCESADLDVRFAAGDHGDNGPFDGQGGTLAHAYFPRDGRLHFDDDEVWTRALRRSGSNPIDLQTVALHELGHALGLRHSNVQGSVMFAFYGGSIRRLTQDDLDGIQSIYGASTAEPEPEPPQPSDDHGDTDAAATLVPTPSSTQGTLAVAGDVDVFRFEAPRGGEALIQTHGEIDTLCELRDQAGALIKKDDDGGEGRNCRIAALLSPGGARFVHVRHFSSTGIGPYTLDVALTEPPEPEPEAQPEPQPDPQPEPQPDPQPDAEPEPQPDPQPDAEPEPQPEPQPEPEPMTPPEPEPSPDRDGDGVPNHQDRCRDTPRGASVWREGQWRGCSGGQRVNPEPEYDTDGDGVPDTEDQCSGTPVGAAIWREGAYKGCAGGQVRDRDRR